jgi:hypothetical protein
MVYLGSGKMVRFVGNTLVGCAAIDIAALGFRTANGCNARLSFLDFRHKNDYLNNTHNERSFQ